MKSKSSSKLKLSSSSVKSKSKSKSSVDARCVERLDGAAVVMASQVIPMARVKRARTLLYRAVGTIQQPACAAPQPAHAEEVRESGRKNVGHGEAQAHQLWCETGDEQWHVVEDLESFRFHFRFHFRCRLRLWGRLVGGPRRGPQSRLIGCEGRVYTYIPCIHVLCIYTVCTYILYTHIYCIHI